jgi:hypothetical protein
MSTPKSVKARGCVVLIRENLRTPNGKRVTEIEIVPDDKWKLVGYIINRVFEDGDE